MIDIFKNKIVLFFGFFLWFFVATISLTAQEGQKKKSTAASNVSVIAKEFVIANLNDLSHKVWVYLPPDYHQTSKKYPVIYMHDAQNLFDNATSYLGEWAVDETLNELFRKTNKGFIVVGIENGGAARIDEYTPWKHEKYGGGKGAFYIDFIVSTLKPYIDKKYRTKRQKKHTSLIGSSLGGLISFYGGLKYPRVFGKIGAFSTSFWFSDKVIPFTEKHVGSVKIKLFLLVGAKEGEDMVSDTKKIGQLLLRKGFRPKNLRTKIQAGGEHNERFWKSEFKEAVRWLYNIK